MAKDFLELMNSLTQIINSIGSLFGSITLIFIGYLIFMMNSQNKDIELIKFVTTITLTVIWGLLVSQILFFSNAEFKAMNKNYFNAFFGILIIFIHLAIFGFLLYISATSLLI